MSQLPMDIINKILITREIHPTARIIKDLNEEYNRVIIYEGNIDYLVYRRIVLFNIEIRKWGRIQNNI